MNPCTLKAALYFVSLIVCWLCSTSVLVSCQAINGLDGEDDNVVGGYYKPGITSAQILEARGFLAKEFFFTTEDNFELSIIRARSPIINNGRGGLANKEPILFIHGTIVSSSIWVTNSRGARPRDFTGVQVNSSSLEQLIEQVGSDPGSFSLPILMMNFGYEVWLLNRRGTLESENRVGSNDRTLLDAIKSIVPTLFGGGFGPNLGLGVFGPAKNSTNVVGNKSSLNSTGQEQVSHFDYNQLIELLSGNLNVESLTRELSVSFDEPQRTRSFLDEFLQPFINLPSALFDFGKFIRRFIRTFDPKFWAFSLDEQARFDVTKAVEFVLKSSGRKQLTLVGHSAGAATILLKLSEEPEFAQKVSKAILLAPALNLGHADSNMFTMFVTPLIQAYVGPIPFTFLTQQLQAIIQVICDFKSTQYTLCEGVADLIVGPGGGQHPITPSISAAILQPTSSRELIHLGQFAADKKPRKFNFNTPDENLKVYGSIEPPIYDLSRIRLQKMSFYAGVSDTLVSPDDVRVTLSQLAAPHRFNLIGGLGVFFNHGGYFDHKRLNKLVAIPVLKDIEHFLQ